MIKALFLKKNNFYYSFRIEGHAGHGFDGNDIVCAGVSSAVDMTINAIKNIIKQDHYLNINSSKAVVFFELKNFEQNFVQKQEEPEEKNADKNIEKNLEKTFMSSVLIKALYSHMVNMSLSFPNNVSVLVSDKLIY